VLPIKAKSLLGCSPLWLLHHKIVKKKRIGVQCASIRKLKKKNHWLKKTNTLKKKIAKKKKCNFFQFSDVASLASIPKNDLELYEDSFFGDV
jgi:hypothetical protein